jgi:hypothetical protein
MSEPDPHKMSGRWVRVERCRGYSHNPLSRFCVCGLVGREVRLGKRYGGRLMRYEQAGYEVRDRPYILVSDEFTLLTPQPPSRFRLLFTALLRALGVRQSASTA